ncbi:MAG TPA: inositol monophosphatase family protein, partial [Verrucomicrobiae bacterium]|nr:inositol monophosphatase family protein [Verrucomicrobiae bacterium]
MKELLDTAVRAALAAGKLQKERLWGEHEIAFKGEYDLVTEVDRGCEELIVAALRESFPDHDFLAEENRYEPRNSPCKWIIDPLDGTTNYAHGFPWFCVSIGLEVEGEMRLGVIYHAVMDELFTAVRGEGAFLNGRRIAVSGRSPLKSCLLATGFPYRKDAEDNNFRNFMTFQTSARAVRRPGAAALDLAYVAAGRLDGYWESGIKAWDTAAGSLLVTEAGGRVTNYAAEPYSVYERRIIASNGLIHDEMAAILRQG